MEHAATISVHAESSGGAIDLAFERVRTACEMARTPTLTFQEAAVTPSDTTNVLG
jgi:hypothetical protein